MRLVLPLQLGIAELRSGSTAVICKLRSVATALFAGVSAFCAALSLGGIDNRNILFSDLLHILRHILLVSRIRLLLGIVTRNVLVNWNI